MNAAVVRRTQEALGKVIRRPPLTEKLLNKPPFRYLHDIITEVIRITGFMKGLYTDTEMKSDNVKDKDAKISFLQKAIDVVVMVSGEPLSAKPARIVAGHEPERTNELLQMIGRCCLSKLSSDEAVKRVLAGEKGDARGRALRTSKVPESDNKNVKEEEARTHKEDRRNSEIKERSTSTERKQKEELKEDSKPREKESKEKAREGDRDRHKDPDRDRREGERERARVRAKQDRDRDRGNKDRDRDVEREKERDRRSEGGKDKERPRDRDRERDRDKGKDRERRRAKNGEHSRDPDREKSREPDKLEKKSASSGEMSKKLLDGPKDTKAEAEAEVPMGASRSLTSKTSKRRSKNSMEGRRDSRASENSLSPEKEHNASYRKAKKDHTMKQLGRKEDNVSAKILDSIVCGLNNDPDQEMAASEIDDHSAGLWRENSEPDPAVKQKGDSPSDTEGEAGPAGQDKPEVSENGEVPSELSSSLRRIPRPGSARPAPPRVKRQESTETLVTDRSGSGRIVSNVIIDSQNSDNEDDEQFVVEAAPQLSEMSEIEMVPAGDVEDEEKHGGLVKKILETKKDYERLQQSPRPGEKERSLVFESAWKKEKDIVSKEIEKLRVSIQTLCKSALPLGKIMDYIQEDVDTMQNELQLWHSENRQHAEALSKEQSITDCAVEPLKAELTELEQQIRDQQDKICAVKANILKNEEKIQKMVHSINLTSRR